MIKIEPAKKEKKVPIQAYISPDLAANIKAIGRGSASGGLKIILESVIEDIKKAAKDAKRS